ncbi:hypothetical protein Bca4012_099464 [Brassica carinata]
MELKTTENQTKGSDPQALLPWFFFFINFKENSHKCIYLIEAMNQVDGKYEAPLEEKEIDTTAFLQKYKKLPLTINEH